MRAGRAPKRHGCTDASSTVVEDGFTLVEVLISLSILSIVMFVVVGGMNILVISSVVNRNQGNIQSVLGRAAEAVRADPYVSCQSTAGSPAPAGAPAFGITAYPLGMPATAAELPENVKGGRILLPFVSKITNLNGLQTLWTPAAGITNCNGTNQNAAEVVWIQDNSVAGTSGGLTQTTYVVKFP